jgi:5-methylthioribose kinase
MFELTPDNALDYLRGRGWLRDEPAHVEALGGGVSNQVLRVVTGGSAFVVKQSRPQLRTRDAWYSDLDRVYREQAVMEALGPLLPPLTVPRVLFADRENYAYAMSHAPEGAVPWKADLLAGKIDLALGEHAGRVLGLMHEGSARQAETFGAFADHTVYVQLRVDPFYRRIQERRPGVAALVGRIIEQMLTVREALCHGDYTPKNVLVHDQGFTLVDYETAHFGDPTMDLGLFLAHLTLKAARLPECRHDYFRLMRAFWQGYCEPIGFRPADELERRGVQHFGVCLLARIDGTSPVEYLPEERTREAIRRLGRSVLQRGIGRWDDAWSCADAELAPLTEARPPEAGG